MFWSPRVSTARWRLRRPRRFPQKVPRFAPERITCVLECAMVRGRRRARAGTTLRTAHPLRRRSRCIGSVRRVRRRQYLSQCDQGHRTAGRSEARSRMVPSRPPGWIDARFSSTARARRLHVLLQAPAKRVLRACACTCQSRSRRHSSGKSSDREYAATISAITFICADGHGRGRIAESHLFRRFGSAVALIGSDL